MSSTSYLGNPKLKAANVQLDFTEEQISEINLETFPSFIDHSLSFQEYAYARGGEPKGKLHPDEKSHQIITDYLYKIVRDSE